jgi:hypothetical protein
MMPARVMLAILQAATNRWRCCGRLGISTLTYRLDAERTAACVVVSDGLVVVDRDACLLHKGRNEACAERGRADS